MSREIGLTQGQVATVDDADYDWLVGVGEWLVLFNKRFSDSNRFRAARNEYRKGVGRRTLLMHRFIMGVQDNRQAQVDHINGNTLDNRRCNLRVVSSSQNRMNVGIYGNNKSGRRGVSWSKTQGKWRTLITVYKKRIHLGYYDSLDEASTVHEAARVKYFGEYNRELLSHVPMLEGE